MSREKIILTIKRTAAIPIIVLFSVAGFNFKACGYEHDLHLTILHTNDVHGHMQSFDYSKTVKDVGGIDRRAYLIKQIKKRTGNVLTLDAGDIAQSEPTFKLFNGVPDVKYLSQMGYDAAELGNHEFDRGTKAIDEMAKATNMPILAANLEFDGDKILQSEIKKYIIKDYNGFKVGIIGLITPELPFITNDLKNVKVLDPEKTASEIIQEIKPKTDFIIVLSHMGICEDIKLAKAVPGVDVIVGGHSHTFLKRAIVVRNDKNRTIIVQDGEFGIDLGRLDLDIQNDSVKSFNYKLLLVDKSVKRDKTISKSLAELMKQVNLTYKKVVGYVKTPIDARRYQTRTGLATSGLLITEAMKAKDPAISVAMINAGDIRANRLFDPGSITVEDVYNISPFDDTLVTADISGKELKSVLESSVRCLPEPVEMFLQTDGINYVVDLSGKPQIVSRDGHILEEGNRIKDMTIAGKPLDLNAMYRIAISDFLSNGGDGYFQFKNLKNVQKTNIDFQDMIVDYIKNNSPLELKIKDSVRYN